jgi:hypothetical protein
LSDRDVLEKSSTEVNLLSWFPSIPGNKPREEPPTWQQQQKGSDDVTGTYLTLPSAEIPGRLEIPWKFCREI